MSLTSYRAAPPRGNRWACRWFARRVRAGRRACREESVCVGFSGLAATYSPASWDAVPSARRRLTAEFGMGSGVSLALLTTRPGKPTRGGGRQACRRVGYTRPVLSMTLGFSTSAGGRVCRLPDRIEACRAISTGQLNALLRLHLRPIDVVVFHGPQGRPGFEGGFPLRCLQRLSCPHIATLHCRWHDNRSTSGAFTPVLSY